MLTNQPLRVMTMDEGSDFAILARWAFLQNFRELLLGSREPDTRLRDVFAGRKVDVAAALIQQATARVEVLRDAKPREKVPNEDVAGITRLRNDRRLSKRQRKNVSRKSFIKTRISGFRDLIFEVLSANPDGLSVEEMEKPIADMLQHDGVSIPDHWDIAQILEVLLKQQIHHFNKLASGKWTATKIPSREISAKYLNSLRVRRCSPTPNPIEHPALLHIIIQRWSSAIGTEAYNSIATRGDAAARAVDAAFGGRKNQPETSPYVSGTHNYPMRYNLVLTRVQATDTLFEMLQKSPACIAALEELQAYALRDAHDNPHHRGPYVYRVTIMGLDGGSVNNDSFQELKHAYPRLDGQLLILEGPRSRVHLPLVLRKPMVDYMRVACLLSPVERKEKTHRSHALWALFDFSMLAEEWNPSAPEYAPVLRGSIAAMLESDQQRIACRKLLMSNMLMYYHRLDTSISQSHETASFTDRVVIRNQTSNGNLGNGRNTIDLDVCVPKIDAFFRVCTWCGEAETLALWTHSIKSSGKQAASQGFRCDRAKCEAHEVEECRRVASASSGLLAGGRPGQTSQTSGSSSSSSDGNDPDASCKLWHHKVDKYCKRFLDPLLHKVGLLVPMSSMELEELYDSSGASEVFSTKLQFLLLVKGHYLRHGSSVSDDDPAKHKPETKELQTEEPETKEPQSEQPEILCKLWHHKVDKYCKRFLDPLLHKDGLLVPMSSMELEALYDSSGASEVFSPKLQFLLLVKGHYLRHGSSVSDDDPAKHKPETKELQSGQPETNQPQKEEPEAKKPKSRKTLAKKSGTKGPKTGNLLRTGCPLWRGNKKQVSIDGNFVAPSELGYKRLYAAVRKFSSYSKTEIDKAVRLHGEAHRKAKLLDTPQKSLPQTVISSFSPEAPPASPLTPTRVLPAPGKVMTLPMTPKKLKPWINSTQVEAKSDQAMTDENMEDDQAMADEAKSDEAMADEAKSDEAMMDENMQHEQLEMNENKEDNEDDVDSDDPAGGIE
jgi:hypothetical protein